MSEGRHYDVLVMGGGTMGTAAAWALAKRGLRPLVLEQFQHVHAMGSHGGETRVIRHAYAESPEYVPLVQRADNLWQELEAESGRAVLIRCGGIEMAAPSYTHARSARASAEEHGLRYEWLDPRDVSKRWPAFQVPDEWDALYSPDAGFLLVEPALREMGEAARRLGATILEDSTVTNWGKGSAGVWAETEAGRFSADAAVITAGAWSSRLLKRLGLPLQVRRKTLWWQEVDDPSFYAPESFPVFIADSDAGEIYGFPIFGVPGLKIANHRGGENTDPDSAERSVRDNENSDCLALARMILPGVGPRVVKSAVCLYTMTPDTDFIVDRHPEHANIAVGAGFSGHGFKFAPAIGELLAELVINERATPPPRLSISRFA